MSWGEPNFDDVLRVINLFSVMSAESQNLSCYEVVFCNICNLVTRNDNRLNLINLMVPYIIYRSPKMIV